MSEEIISFIDFTNMNDEEKYKLLNSKDCEIERLNKKLENLEKLNNANYESFIEVNNIINEFDKWLDEESEKTILSTGHLACLMMCKNKLQELKGVDKE